MLTGMNGLSGTVDVYIDDDGEEAGYLVELSDGRMFGPYNRADSADRVLRDKIDACCKGKAAGEDQAVRLAYGSTDGQ